MIPGQATAKVSFRLVGAQDPQKIRAAFHAFVRARLPADAKVEFKSFASAPATELPFDNPALAKTRAALAAEWGKKALAIGEGGSIPIVGDFKRVLGMDTDRGRFRARRRPRAFAEREIRPDLLSQGHAQLGADFGRVVGLSKSSVTISPRCVLDQSLVLRIRSRGRTGSGTTHHRRQLPFKAMEEQMVAPMTIKEHMEVFGSDGVHIGARGPPRRAGPGEADEG